MRHCLTKQQKKTKTAKNKKTKTAKKCAVEYDAYGMLVIIMFSQLANTVRKDSLTKEYLCDYWRNKNKHIFGIKY